MPRIVTDLAGTAVGFGAVALAYTQLVRSDGGADPIAAPAARANDAQDGAGAKAKHTKRDGAGRDDAKAGERNVGADPTPTPAASPVPDSNPSDKLRVATLNLHELVPSNLVRSDRNESAAALQDVADWINEHDPDVIVFQELDEDRNRAGLGSQLNRLTKLVGGTDAMLASRFASRNGLGNDNAIITRNGVELVKAQHARLPELPSGEGRRSVGIAEVRTDAGATATVMFTHLNASWQGDRTQDEHMAVIADIARSAYETGAVSFKDRDSGNTKDVELTPGSPVILMGDFNAGVTELDRYLKRAGLKDILVNTMHAPGIPDQRAEAKSSPAGTRRIDHIFTSPNAEVVDTFVSAVEPRAVARDGSPGGKPTDHKGVIADLQLGE